MKTLPLSIATFTIILLTACGGREPTVLTFVDVRDKNYRITLTADSDGAGHLEVPGYTWDIVWEADTKTAKVHRTLNNEVNYGELLTPKKGEPDRWILHDLNVGITNEKKRTVAVEKSEEK